MESSPIDPQGSNPVQVQSSNSDEGGNPTQGSNPDDYQSSNSEEGSNPNDEEQGSNPDSISQSSNSVDDEDESARSPSNLGPSIQAIPGDSEIFIRRPLQNRRIASPINNETSTSTNESIVFTLQQWEEINKHRLTDVAMSDHENTSNSSKVIQENVSSAKSETVNQASNAIRTKRVPDSRRLKTPEHVTKGIKDNQIHLGAGKHRQLMNIHMELQSTCLLSLLLGERRQPTWNGGIDTGYTPQKVVPKSRPQIPALENMSTSENTSTFSSQADPVYTTIFFCSTMTRHV
jgi:hypothetical protein